MVSVIVPVFNKAELTGRCLESVLAHSTQVKEVFVIDNASQDETPTVLESLKARFEAKTISFHILTNLNNLGFGKAMNQGIRLAQGEYLALLNNDTWMMPEWDAALIRALKEHSLDLIGPFFDERPGTSDLFERSQRFLRNNRPKRREHFVPILMFFSRRAVEVLKLPHGGLFDERFFVTYEDTDLLHRLKLAGLRYAQTSTCYIWHHSMGTRASPGLLPSGYEQQGLQLFIEKWGFDPRTPEHTWLERIKRKIRKANAARGKF